MINGAIDHAKHHYGVVRTMATKSVITNFADQHGLVYFGSVSQHHDDHHLVRGITLSTHHRDRHYCVGAIDGYDMILVQRTDALQHPGRNAHHTTWIIMQFDLHVRDDLPHIFLCKGSYDDAFHTDLSYKFRYLKKIDPVSLSGHDKHFIRSYHVYADHAKMPDIAAILSTSMTTEIGRHFNMFDYEIVDDKLYVYSNNTVTTRNALNDISRIGLWLSKQLDAQY